MVIAQVIKEDLCRRKGHVNVDDNGCCLRCGEQLIKRKVVKKKNVRAG